MGSEPYIRMVNIHKIYPDGTYALRGVEFEVDRGEIVGLLGENGAGKTTLMKILSGLLKPTKGQIFIGGKPVSFSNPGDALRLGIGMVHQFFSLVPIYNAVENILLGQEVGSSSPLALLSPPRVKEARRKLAELADRVGLKVPLDTPIEMLPPGVQQRVEILKLLYRGMDVLIFDEPTSFLTPLEVEELFKTLRRLRDEGKAIVFITHKLREALAITDRITVLRGGLVTGKVKTGEATPQQLAVMMVGSEVIPRVTRSRREAGDPVLSVRDLWVKNDIGLYAVKGISFEVREGEIFGVVGVEGNGQSELIQAITGLRKAERGEVRLRGNVVTNLSPKALYERGLAHIPEDRLRFGLAMDFDVAENSILGRQWERLFLGPLGRLNWESILNFAKRIVEAFNVVVPGLRSPVKSLSGGNQQRLVAGRELTKRADLVVAAHPTRGLDIASTNYIRELLVKMRDEGKGVLLVTADLDEALQLSDRIAVMYEGELLGVGRVEDFTREEIGMMMGGIRIKREGERLT